MLWLWYKLAATAPIRPLAWEPPHASSAALEKTERPKKKKKEIKMRYVKSYINLTILIITLTVNGQDGQNY